jgi:aryl-alcohol dehydrogenase-like predicted oxidoreductase
MTIRRAFEDLAKSKGCTPGQLALAWVLAQGEDVVHRNGASACTTFRGDMKWFAIRRSEPKLALKQYPRGMCLMDLGQVHLNSE